MDRNRLTDALAIPPLGLERTPYPPNPSAAPVLADTLRWAAEHGIDAMVGAEKCTDLARLSLGILAHTEPTLNERQLTLPARQCLWLFAYDSHVDGEVEPRPEFAEVLGTMRQILQPGAERLPANPYATALGSIALQVRTATNETQSAMWVDAVQGYNDAAKTEMRYQQSGMTPTRGAFKRMRWHTSGVQVMFSLIAPARGIMLPDTAWQDRTLKIASRAAGDAVALDNDLFSLRKELAAGQAGLNAATIMRHSHPGYSLQQAVDAVVGKRNKAERRFLSQQEACAQAGADPAVLEYVRGLGFWIKGQLQFVYEQASRANEQRYSG